MKLLLVQPYHPSSVTLWGRAYMSQLTLPLLAAYTPPDVEIEIRDENVDKLDFDAPVDLVGITALTSSAPRAYEIADTFRARGVPVVLGGVHPTLLPDEAKAHADAVVLGEAENIWAQVVRDAEQGQLEPFYCATERPDMKNLAIPRRDLANQKKYIPLQKMEVSRGCPFNCSFCSTTVFFGSRMRYRPVEEIVAEAELLRGKGTATIFFTDNNIVGSPRYAKQLFRALAPVGIQWCSQGALNLARDDELMDLARESGCVGMLIGFESLSPDSLAEAGKKTNRVEEYEQAVQRLHDHGIAIIGCFVMGFDHDDPTTFDRTAEFVERTNIDVPQITVLTPFPGTELRRQLESQGRILSNDWSLYDAVHVLIRPQRMSPLELRAGYERMCNQLYSHQSILRRTLRSTRYLPPNLALSYYGVNLVYRRLYQVGLKDNDMARVRGYMNLTETQKRGTIRATAPLVGSGVPG